MWNRRTAIVALALAGACGGAAESQPKPAAGAVAGVREDIAVEKFAQVHAGGAQVVDVRTEAEFSGGHVPGAILVPIGELKPDDPRLAGLDKSKPVYFICAVGGRSSKASDQMAAAGWHAVNVLGGTNAWVAAGNPVDKAAP